jgi:SAM-dependent methyltransferase
MERKPYKAYLYRQAQRAVDGRTFDVCVDVACGEMQAANWVNCRRYIGVDLDGERLKRGVAAGPGREAIHARIEDMAPDIRGNLVLCFETIGVNKHAPVDRSLAYVERLVGATLPDGTLIFNLGSKGAGWSAPVREALDRAFGRVSVVRYGRFISARWRPITGLLVAMMERWPGLATSPKRAGHLYIAEGRLT